MKRLVLCFDGTWEARPSHRQRRKGHFATNVEKTHIAVEKRDASGNLQVTWYHSGIGSGAIRYWPGATGYGISAAICDGYAFIADNFELGCDQLYIFGFSRGAYTARSLCGFMQWVGILKKVSLVDLPEAYDEYQLPENKRDDRYRGEQLQSLKERDFDSFPIRFLGVWDTVGSVGLPVPVIGTLVNPTYHDVALTRNIQYAYQALAIHERRLPFKAEIWTSKHPRQTVEQAWFAGTHADVGGGNESTQLSDIALLWMARQAEQLGLAFDQNYLAEAKPDPRSAVFNSSSGVWRAVPRRRRTFGEGVDECCHASVPLHVAHFSKQGKSLWWKVTHPKQWWGARRPKQWRKAEEAALLLPDCATCAQSSAAVLPDAGVTVDAAHTTQEEQEAASAEFLKKWRQYWHERLGNVFPENDDS